jgi:hypothetical protein
MARKGYEQQGPLPTVSHFKGHKVSKLLVSCRGASWHHQDSLPIGGLSDLNLIELAGRLRFRCSKCGGTKIELRPDWASRPSDKARAGGWLHMPP